MGEHLQFAETYTQELNKFPQYIRENSLMLLKGKEGNHFETYHRILLFIRRSDLRGN